jgi:hypothetical protein
MKQAGRSKSLILSVLPLSSPVAAEVVRQFQLDSGWNAIYLDVDPGGAPPAEVFGGDLVDAVARYVVPPTQVRFIESPDEEPWNNPGWAVWYSGQRAESFLNNLHAVDGGAAYLVHAVKPGALAVTGKVRPGLVKWRTDSFNLAGFPVDTPGITFAQYFV